MPHLIISKGSHFSKIVSFQNSISIGRDQQNDIVLESAGVSRIHAAVKNVGGAYVLQDQNSTNGITVGDEEIERYSLSPGITFRIVDYLLTYVEDPDQQSIPAHMPGKFAQTDLLSEKVGETLWIKQSTGKSRLGLQQKIAEMLQLVTSFASHPFDKEKGGGVLETLLRITGAKRGLIALNSSSGNFTYSHSRGFNGKDIDQVVSRTLLAQALEEGRFVFKRSALDEDPTQSTVALSLKSIICVPLSAGNKVFGCLYLDHPEYKGAFSEEDRDLVFAVAEFLGPAFNPELTTKRHLNPEDAKMAEKLALSEIVAHSPKTLNVFKGAESVARYNVSVLIYGETGTGKEVVARFLHQRSGRKGAFIARNCSAIAPTVFESELFGHEKGAFTGAVARKPGIFELAQNGTIFLDEIGDMPSDMQVKLLRALQEKEIWRVGGTAPIKIDVRVLAATHQDIKNNRGQINFRDDLYYRLANVEITMPPLRERVEDIGPLCKHILKRIANENYIDKRLTIPAKVLRILEAYDWPGNIRELGNILLQLYMKTETDCVEPHHLKGLIDVYDYPEDRRLGPMPSLEEVEREHILKALKKTGWNKSATANMLKIDRNRLSRRLKKLNIDIPA